MTKTKKAKLDFEFYAWRIYAGDAATNAEGLGQRMQALREAYVQDAVDEMRQREHERDAVHVG